MFEGRMPADGERYQLLARGVVLAEPGRCVQCGICAWNCPMGIDTRRYAREGRAIADSACILCGSCVARCPRGTLRFGELPAAVTPAEPGLPVVPERAA